MEEKLIMETTSYLCGDCGGRNWTLRIGHRSDNKTFLLICCADPICVEKKRKEVDAETTDHVIWDELDITGMGYDIQDIDEPRILN